MTCSAVIIENRDIPNIEKIIEAHERYIPKGWEVFWVKDEDVKTMADYNKLLTSKRFWRVMTDKVLIFQHDSMLLREGIEEFTEWDYIGAPIPRIGYPAMNGGFSLRDSKAMLKVINNIPYIGGNEDMYFCNGLLQLGGKLPDYETAQKFSCETTFHIDTLGYHAIDKYLTPKQCSLVKAQYYNWSL